MRAPTFDPARLDVAAFARAQAKLTGHTPLAHLKRLAESTVAPADGAVGEVEWSATGLCKQPAGRAAELRLHLVARTKVWLTCQRCLQPTAHALEVDGVFRFVPGEDEAARLDEESEEDVLALPRWLKLDELIEDELILALPIVPRHEQCPQPLVVSGEAAADGLADGGEPGPSPFAALARWKSGQTPG